jgi:hypothetical protein
MANDDNIYDDDEHDDGKLDGTTEIARARERERAGIGIHTGHY